MEEQIINIATLTIDGDKANATAAQTKKEIFDLQQANADIRKAIKATGDASGELTAQFVENDKQLKKLNADYRVQIAAINDLTLAELKTNKALTETAKSRDQQIAQNKELKILRGQIDQSTEEGAKAYELLNQKINENDAALKASGTSAEKQAANIGNYPNILDKVGEAYGGVTAQAIGFVQSGRDVISSFTEIGTQATAAVQQLIGFKNETVRTADAERLMAINSSAAGEGAEAAGEGAEGGAQGIMGMTKAAWAFVANPIGAIIAAIVIVLGILIAVFKTFQPLIDKFEQGMAAIAAVVNVVKNTILALVTGTKSLGEAFSSLGGDMADAAKRAAELTKAQQDLEDAMKSQEVTSARNRAEINKLNVQAKNRTLSEKERLALLDQAAKIEAKDFAQRKALVDEEVRQAREAIAIKAQFTDEEIELLKRTGDATKDLAESRGGIYDDEYDALNKARIKAIELENESTSNLEKIYNKRDKLEDEAAAKAEARRQKAQQQAEKALANRIKNAETEIAIERAKNAQLALDAEAQLAFLDSITQKEIDLINFKVAHKVLTEKEGQLEILQQNKQYSEQTLALAQKVIAQEQADQQKKFNDQKTLTEEQQTVALANAAFLRDIEVKRIEESKLLASEKAIALQEIEKGYLESVAIIDKNYEETKKQEALVAAEEARALRDIEFEMRMLQLEDQGMQEAELQKDLLAIQLEQKKAALDDELEAGSKTAKEVAALKLLEDTKYANATKKIDKEVQAFKRAGGAAMLKDALSVADSIFGENKALAVAAALINTYQGISAGVALGYPAAIPAVALAAATGFAAVRNILKTNKNGGGASGGSTAASSGAGGAESTTSASPALFETPAKVQGVATVDTPPGSDNAPIIQPVLVVADLDEVKGQTEIKIKSS